MFDEKVVAADMLDFLKEFRAAHPSYFDAPLFITGESYAGQPQLEGVCFFSHVPASVFASQCIIG